MRTTPLICRTQRFLSIWQVITIEMTETLLGNEGTELTEMKEQNDEIIDLSTSDDGNDRNEGNVKGKATQPSTNASCKMSEDQKNEDTSGMDVGTSCMLSVSYSMMMGMSSTVVYMMTPQDKNKMSASFVFGVILMILHVVLSVIMMTRLCLRCKCFKNVRCLSDGNAGNKKNEEKQEENEPFKGNDGNEDDGQVPECNGKRRLPMISFILSVAHFIVFIIYVITTGVHMTVIMSDQSEATPAPADESLFGTYSPGD